MKLSRVFVILSFASLASFFPGTAVFPAQAGINKNIVKLLSEATQALCAMEYDKAIEKCDATLKIDANCSSAYYIRGFAYRYKQDYDRAIIDFTRAIGIDNKYAAAYYGRGMAFAYKGDYRSAIADFSAAIEVDPKYTDAYFSRARVYYDLEEFDKAWDDLHRAEALGLQQDIMYKGFVAKLKQASGRD